MTQQYITLWRKPAPDNLDWDFHVSLHLSDAETVVANIKARGVHQYRTYTIGDHIADLSSEY